MEKKEPLAKPVEEFLEGLGLDLSRLGMEKTPERVAKMYGELFSGLGPVESEEWGELFESDAKGLVAVRHIPFYSMCEHHLLPFYGKAHVAYIPDGILMSSS